MNGPWISACSVNPELGLDHVKARLFLPADRVKKVAVIGGGPAGMYAACLLRDRGHQVTLFEKTPVLGGQLVHADYADFKWTIKHFKDWQIRQCEKKGVELRLGCTPTPEELKQERFDTVVAALGGAPAIPDIPGLKKPNGALSDNVFTPISVFGDLDKLGRRVAIIGGSEIGCETGMYVAQSGREVTVFTRQSQLAPSAQRVHYGLPAFGYHGLKQKLRCTTTSVEDGTLHYTNYKGDRKSMEFDSIIVSGGVHPQTQAALAYYGCAPEFYIAGDCAGDGEGSLQKCLRSAYGIASQI
jgi:NADPH-dependent 2,4-dienoyl-CoA reductase/sulfur reductase-like enzyme